MYVCEKKMNGPFYSCALSCQAFNLEWGWSWPCCDKDQYLVSMITKSPAFEKRQSLYHNKVTLSLTLVQRLGNQACNCKVDYWLIVWASGKQSCFLIHVSLYKNHQIGWHFWSNKAIVTRSPYKLNVEKLWSTGHFPCLFFSTTHCLIVPSWCFEGRRVLL